MDNPPFRKTKLSSLGIIDSSGDRKYLCCMIHLCLIVYQFLEPTSTFFEPKHILILEKVLAETVF